MSQWEALKYPRLSKQGKGRAENISTAKKLDLIYKKKNLKVNKYWIYTLSKEKYTLLHRVSMRIKWVNIWKILSMGHIVNTQEVYAIVILKICQWKCQQILQSKSERV